MIIDLASERRRRNPPANTVAVEQDASRVRIAVESPEASCEVVASPEAAEAIAQRLLSAARAARKRRRSGP